MACCHVPAPATTTRVMKGSIPRKGMLDTCSQRWSFWIFYPSFFFSQASFELISTNFHCCHLPSYPFERSETPTCPNSTSLGGEGDVSIRELGERVCYSTLVSVVFIFLFPSQPHSYRPTCSRTFSFLLAFCLLWLLWLPFCARFPLLEPWVFDMRNDFQQNSCVIY